MPKKSQNGEAADSSRQNSHGGAPAANGSRPVTAAARGKRGRRFRQTIFYDWCKACGICIAFCPHQVFRPNEQGKPLMARPEKCTGCGFCEIHCPDFAITIVECPGLRHKEKSCDRDSLEGS